MPLTPPDRPGVPATGLGRRQVLAGIATAAAAGAGGLLAGCGTAAARPAAPERASATAGTWPPG